MIRETDLAERRRATDAAPIQNHAMPANGPVCRECCGIRAYRRTRERAECSVRTLRVPSRRKADRARSTLVTEIVVRPWDRLFQNLRAATIGTPNRGPTRWAHRDNEREPTAAAHWFCRKAWRNGLVCRQAAR